MALPYEWMLGTRYLRATRGRGFLSFITLVSVFGLAIGVAVLIVVLSVMNGFERELKTVSYTHLDVYKRQPRHRSRARTQRRPRRRGSPSA